MVGPDGSVLSPAQAQVSGTPHLQTKSETPSGGAPPRRGLDIESTGQEPVKPSVLRPVLPRRSSTDLASLSPVELAGEHAAPALVPGADVVSGAEALLVAADDADQPDDEARGRVTVAGRSFAAWSRLYIGASVVLDGLLGAVAVLIPALFSETLSQAPTMTTAALLCGALLWPVSIACVRGYHHNQVGYGGEELRGPLRAAVALVVIGAFGAQLSGQHTVLALILTAVPLAAVLSLALRFVLRKILHFSQRRGRHLRRVVVAGSSGSIRELHARLSHESHHGMTVIGACVPRGELGLAPDLDVPILGDLEYVTTAVREFGCDTVAVTSDDATRNSYLRKIAWSLEGVGVEMLVDPGLVEVAGPRMHIRPILGLPLVHVEQPRFTGWKRVLKRITDIGLTAVGLVAISPLLMIIALAVKITDGGPVLFRQTRVGRAGKPFTMLKFRSMVVDAEARKASLMTHNEGHGALFKMTHDPRVTRIGQMLRDFSLDELPQLFNVLAGSMSLVGPRPHLATEIAEMPAEASRRSLVTPGLTGLWQVSGRSNLDATESVRLDLRYVENWSFTLDLLILWKTASAVLAKRGAH